LDVAGELHGQRAARAADAEVFVELRALVENDRHGRERNDVVDDRRLAEEALDRGQRRTVAHHAALALEALEERRFLAADVGAGRLAYLEMEGSAAALHV